MSKLKNKLQIEQLDNKMEAISVLEKIAMPSTGWLNAIRTGLNMSLRQLGNRLKITPQSMKEIEQREKEGSLTIKGLQDAAHALDMKLVYGLIPKDGSLEELIDKKAKELATKIVMRTSDSMKLEDQENSERRLQKAIEERANELKRDLPKILWD